MALSNTEIALIIALSIVVLVLLVMIGYYIYVAQQRTKAKQMMANMCTIQNKGHIISLPPPYSDLWYCFQPIPLATEPETTIVPMSKADMDLQRSGTLDVLQQKQITTISG